MMRIYITTGIPIAILALISALPVAYNSPPQKVSTSDTPPTRSIDNSLIHDCAGPDAISTSTIELLIKANGFTLYSPLTAPLTTLVDYDTTELALVGIQLRTPRMMDRYKWRNTVFEEYPVSGVHFSGWGGKHDERGGGLVFSAHPLACKELIGKLSAMRARGENTIPVYLVNAYMLYGIDNDIYFHRTYKDKVYIGTLWGEDIHWLNLIYNMQSF